MDKRGWVRSLCHLHKVYYLAIQETKMVDMDLLSVHTFWVNANFMHSFSPSRSASGDILVVWNPDHISHKQVIITDNYLAINTVWTTTGLEVMFIVIYTPQGVVCKPKLWVNILDMVVSFTGECILMGEFNELQERWSEWDLLLIRHPLELSMILLSMPTWLIFL